MKRVPLLVALLACLLAPGPAQAGDFTSGAGVFFVGGSPTARTVAQSHSVVRMSGEFVVTFEGDPATCAAAGRCDTRGTVTWRPSRRQSLYLIDLVDRGKRAVQAVVFPGEYGEGGAETTSHVRRARSGGGTALCTDARTSFSGLEATVVGRRLVFGVPPRSAGPLDSNCGGPLWSDLRNVLPRPRWDLSEFRRRGGAADLRTEQPFVAGGLRGTVRSSLVASLSRPRRQRPENGTTTDEEPEPRVRTQSWHVDRVSGSVRVDVRGSESPVRCAALDACGLAGSVTLTPRAGGEAEAVTYLADVPDDGRRLVGGGGWLDAGSASAMFMRPDAPAPCIDTVPLQAAGLFFAERGGQVTVSYEPLPALRSRCAGPSIGAGLGSATGLASGTAPLASFRRSERVVIRLTRGVTRTVQGYGIATHPDLTIELVRKR